MALLTRAVNEYEIDSVFHLGAQTIVGTAKRSALSTFEANVRGTWNLLEACNTCSGLVERVVSVAGESFDSRLRTGAAELDLRKEAIDLRMTGAQQRLDEQLGSVVESLQKKIDEVDRIVAEKVGGLTETVGERVGGMSKNLGQQVTSMSGELQQVRTLVAELQKID